MLPTHAKRMAEQYTAFDPTSGPRMHDDLTLIDDDEGPSDGQENALSDNERRQAREQYLNNLQQTERISPEANRNESPHLDPAQRSSTSSQHGNSWTSQGRKSPNNASHRDSGQWPLRSLSFNKYAPEQPPHASPQSDTGSWTANKSQGQVAEGANYSLMPSVQSTKEMEQRLSSRSPMPQQQNAVSEAAGIQPVRLPEEPEMSEKEKKKGCAGCCIVM